MVQPFRVAKDPADFGIDEHDGREGSELAYRGPEVRPLQLALSGSQRHARALRGALHPATATRPTGGQVELT